MTESNAANSKIYKAGTAPAHLATRHQLAEKKLVPLADPAASVRLKSGALLSLYDWRDTKHSRTAAADAARCSKKEGSR